MVRYTYVSGDVRELISPEHDFYIRAEAGPVIGDGGVVSRAEAGPVIGDGGIVSKHYTVQPEVRGEATSVWKDGEVVVGHEHHKVRDIEGTPVLADGGVVATSE
jgi:hypothetical protein